MSREKCINNSTKLKSHKPAERAKSNLLFLMYNTKPAIVQYKYNILGFILICIFNISSYYCTKKQSPSPVIQCNKTIETEQLRKLGNEYLTHIYHHIVHNDILFIKTSLFQPCLVHPNWDDSNGGSTVHHCQVSISKWI